MWRIYVLERDGYICRKCGVPGNNGHHVKSFVNHPRLRLDVSNGITLCDDCHRREPTERMDKGAL
jgi:5-methylcytosine-specific restriction endonuclease McrA